MRLTRLELSGFKSFAKTTVLEFPSRITAIVGPNGSGKSNIKDAIQWVLGEQSIKSLRGKKGEDLIWNGSSTLATGGSRPSGAPRMGKAAVTLVFDNSDRQLPIEFDELLLSRKIFRDGVNEYMINNSVVRMRDVAMMTARMGLGEQKHNIIGQGEVDRILMASGRERRGMLEEALGLRVYQLKKNETERKLAATEENVKQVESLIRELSPHLKFLRMQAQKAEQRERTEAELENFQKAYWAAELRSIEAEKARVSSQVNPVHAKEEEINVEIIRLGARLTELEESTVAHREVRGAQRKTEELGTRRREMTRELGRIEGRLEAEREKISRPQIRVVDVPYVQERITQYITQMRKVLLENENLENVRSRSIELIEHLEQLLVQIERGIVEGEILPESPLIRELGETISSLQYEIHQISQNIEQHEQARQKEYEEFRQTQSRIREIEGLLRAKQEEQRDVMLEYQRFHFEEERIHAREEELDRELGQSGIAREKILESADGNYAVFRPEDIKRRIERLSGKLEEIGGIDPSVVNEYKETEGRHAFLTKELEDVRQASTSLAALIRELDEHMRRDFHEGFANINKEFHTYFGIIFGGGKAALRMINDKLQISNEENEIDEEQEQKVEEEIEIEVDLPRKRIKGLAMLSGGERALTSLALLFAIAAVHPPPFLILDETDAALDEANSQRYGAMLTQLAKRTQLIVITHNRETMKSAGVLYGITMGDDGVSKLLSLKLEEAKTYTSR